MKIIGTENERRRIMLTFILGVSIAVNVICAVVGFAVCKATSGEERRKAKRREKENDNITLY